MKAKTSLVSVSLSDERRKRLIATLITERFEKPVRALVPKHASLALAVYHDYFTRSQIEKMSSLPDGWLPKLSHIGARFGVGDGSHVNLSFNGEFPLFRDIICCNARNLPDVERPVPYNRMHLSEDYAKDHVLTAYREKLRSEVRSLRAEIDKIKLEISGVLNSVTTTGKLVSVWPEIETTVRKLFPIERVNLPAPVVTDLNLKLGLKPVRQKKAA